jgi:hypothetical protein
MSGFLVSWTSPVPTTLSSQKIEFAPCWSSGVVVEGGKVSEEFANVVNHFVCIGVLRVVENSMQLLCAKTEICQEEQHFLLHG